MDRSVSEVFTFKILSMQLLAYESSLKAIHMIGGSQEAEELLFKISAFIGRLIPIWKKGLDIARCTSSVMPVVRCTNLEDWKQDVMSLILRIANCKLAPQLVRIDAFYEGLSLDETNGKRWAEQLDLTKSSLVVD